MGRLSAFRSHLGLLLLGGRKREETMNDAQADILRQLPTAERGLVMNHYNANKKKVSTGVLLALLLGGIGIHHFYLGRTFAGVLSLFLFWTFLPAIFALLEALFMSSIVAGVNRKVFEEALLVSGVQVSK
jgi:TM2 domain-containing membrane protein YozV